MFKEIQNELKRRAAGELSPLEAMGERLRQLANGETPELLKARATVEAMDKQFFGGRGRAQELIERSGGMSEIRKAQEFSKQVNELNHLPPFGYPALEKPKPIKFRTPQINITVIVNPNVDAESQNDTEER